MKSLRIALPVFCLCFLLTPSFVSAQDENMEDMEKVWMAYMTPGEPHAMMAKSAGEWNTKTTSWMVPGAEPMVLKVKLLMK